MTISLDFFPFSTPSQKNSTTAESSLSFFLTELKRYPDGELDNFSFQTWLILHVMGYLIAYEHCQGWKKKSAYIPKM